LSKSEQGLLSLEAAPQLHLNNQVCFAAYALSRRITQAYQPYLKKLGLTYPQYLVLLVLWEALENGEQSVRVGRLCEELMLDTGTVTPLLKRMEQGGLLSRCRASDDERVVVITLTDAGVELRNEVLSLPFETLCTLDMEVAEALSLKDRMWQWLKRWAS